MFQALSYVFEMLSHIIAVVKSTMYSPWRMSGPRAFLRGARCLHFVSDVALFVDAIAAMANASEASATMISLYRLA